MESETLNLRKDPFFQSKAMKPSSITQHEVTNRDCNSTQGMCDLGMYDDDDDNDEDFEETNNNIYPPDELDIENLEFDTHRKDYSSMGSDLDSFSLANGHGADLSAMYQDDWQMDKMYWNEDGHGMGSLIHSSDTASIMSFDSSTTASSAVSENVPNQSKAKADVVYTLLSMLHTHDKMEVSKMLLAMSSSRENCIAMVESGCLPLLVQLLHDRSEKPSYSVFRQNVELKKNASQILRNIVHSQQDDKKGKREARVLRLLEHVRDYCDYLHSILYKVGSTDTDKCTDQQLGPTVAALMKLSFDEEHRHAMCLLGALPAVAELIEVDQAVHGCTSDEFCIMIRRYSGMVLTNLTFGDGTNKSFLCSMTRFMQALLAQLESPSEELRQVCASVLRNLSWRADHESKKVLREVGAVTVLMQAAMQSTKESTLKSILSALWNMSAHCSENKADICQIDGALGFLVGTLNYKSSAKNLAVVENGGGILRNVSSHIAIQNEHRITLRQHNCLQILLHHLRSPSLTVVSNACGTLWNLSARNPQDQRLLWEMGAVGMLKKLINSKHKMISMGSSAALKNLLSAVPPGVTSGFGAPLNDLNSGMPLLQARKLKMLNMELDENLAETYDNTDIPKSESGYRRKPSGLDNRRTHSAPAQRQGIPQRISKAATNNDVKKASKECGIPRYNSRSSSMPKELPQTNHVVDIALNSGNNQKIVQANQQQNGIKGQFALPRPFSYPAQNKDKGNAAFSQPKYGVPNQRPQDRSRSPAYIHSRKSLPASNNYSNVVQKITSIMMNNDNSDYQEQPVNYSLKYSEESKCGADSKIPRPNSKGPTEKRNQQPSVAPLCINTSRESVCTKTNGSFAVYTDSDSDDQVVDYSKKYRESESSAQSNGQSRLPSPPDKKVPKPETNYEDTAKVYCTEDTPVNFSSASSLTDICDIDSLPSRPKRYSLQDNVVPEEVPFDSIERMVEEFPEKNTALKDKEAKVTKSGEEPNCNETPLMFSRCSSLGSLSSFDQPSIQDGRSSVSDFSHMASGIISPSELPDSPSQTMPPSPQSKKSFIFNEKQLSPDAPVQTLSTIKPKSGNKQFGQIDKYTSDGSSQFSMRNNLNVNEKQTKANFVKSPQSKHPDNGRNGVKQKSWNVQPSQSNGHAGSQVPYNIRIDFGGWEGGPVPSILRQGNRCSSMNDFKSIGCTEDTVKVYYTEGTPNLSHSASFSDLSMLSFNAERSHCSQSLEESSEESDEGCNTVAKVEGMANRNSKVGAFRFQGHANLPNANVSPPEDTMKYEDSKKATDFNEERQRSVLVEGTPLCFSRNSSLSSLSIESTEGSPGNELLQECLQMGMPKKKQTSPLQNSGMHPNGIHPDKPTSANSTYPKPDLVSSLKQSWSNEAKFTKKVENLPVSVKQDNIRNSSDVASTYKQAMTQQYVQNGMPSKKDHSHSSSPSKKSILSKDKAHMDKDWNNKAHSPVLSKGDKEMLQECLTSGMPQNNSYLKCSGQSSANKTLPKACLSQSPELTEADLLQECLSLGMPQKKEHGNMKQDLSDHNLKEHNKLNVQNDPGNIRRGTANHPPSKSSCSKDPTCEGMPKKEQTHLIRTNQRKDHSSQKSSDRTHSPELSQDESEFLQECMALGMPQKKDRVHGNSANLKKDTSHVRARSPELSIADKELLQQCMSLGMPQKKDQRRPQQGNLKRDLSDQCLKECNGKSNTGVNGSKLSKDREISHSDEMLLRQCILSGNKGLDSGAQQKVKTDNFSSKMGGSSGTVGATSGIPKPKFQNISNKEVKSLPSQPKKTPSLMTNGKMTPAKHSQELQPEFKAAVQANELDLTLEAQKVTDMLDAVDNYEDMNVSTLSCLSDIENATPPSILGEFSLSNSDESIKQLKFGKHITSAQKSCLLKELHISRLGSDSDLSQLKSSSLRSNTEIVDNINPPSILGNLSLTASTGSLDSIHSNILDSKSHDVGKNYTSDDNSLNERMCEAAVMAQMFTKEFSNITGVKTAHNESNVAGVRYVSADAYYYDDATEPACDTISCDEFVDDLPCDDDDLGSETLVAPQSSSLKKDDTGDGSTENLTFTLTEEPRMRLSMRKGEQEKSPTTSDYDALRQNADLILNSLKKAHISESNDANDMLEDETLSLVSNGSDEDDSA